MSMMRTAELSGPLSGKADIDPALDVERLVVHGTDADLAAVAIRLLRKGKLQHIAVAYLPSGESEVAVRAHPDTVRTAAVTSIPLIRDDHGGVVVGAASAQVTGATVYCDSTAVLYREAGTVLVRPGGAGVEVTVRRRFRRTRTATGRAVQFGCAPCQPVTDGQPHPRPLERWSWYRHTEDLRLVTA
ncbi:hypothetical protein [Sciscionella sediminilitoris]|uniref:hypothetical protein n=1 Tax=Sciscionella sediminilitoris TaxID=1445613 RepID=UPI0012E31BC6|nr:hypothetical protein [Sciscionella sp. SE31]